MKHLLKKWLKFWESRGRSAPKKSIEPVPNLFQQLYSPIEEHIFQTALYTFEINALKRDDIKAMVLDELCQLFLYDIYDRYSLPAPMRDDITMEVKEMVDNGLVVVEDATAKFESGLVVRTLMMRIIRPGSDTKRPKKVTVIAGAGELSWGDFAEVDQLSVKDFIFNTYQTIGKTDVPMDIRVTESRLSSTYTLKDAVD